MVFGWYQVRIGVEDQRNFKRPEKDKGFRSFLFSVPLIVLPQF